MDEEGTLVGEDFNSDFYSLYFKGFIREETTGLIARFGVVICIEEDDNLLFLMKGSLHVSVVKFLEAELMALKRGLTKAMSLGIDHMIYISIYCDNNQIFKLIMGRSTHEKKNIALLMSNVQRIRQHLTSSIQVLVTRDQSKFGYKLAMESLSICMPPAQTKTYDICFNDDIKRHQDERLLGGISKPRCLLCGCKSNQTLRSCAHLLTPKERKICERTIKHDSIPEWDRFHCPKPMCKTLMLKSEVLEEYKTSRSAPMPTTIVWRQCRSCQHIIKVLKKPMYKLTCRCGFSFCYICGAQSKLEGCSHYLHMVADALIAFLLIFILIIIWV